MVAASLSAVLAGVSEARAAVVAALVAQIAVTWRLVLRASARRDIVLDLIVDGREALPLRSVARERRRLLDRRHRVLLARALDALREEAAIPLVRRSSPLPLYSRRVVAAVAPELEETAQALRRSDASVRGVALSERLLSGHDSPLYGDDADRLREELRRVRFLLDAAVTERRSCPRGSATIRCRALARHRVVHALIGISVPGLAGYAALGKPRSVPGTARRRPADDSYHGGHNGGR